MFAASWSSLLNPRTFFMQRIIELRQQKTAIKNQMRDMLENA
ncbi:phage major capsid protein, partial [Escherichia coli]